MQSIRRKFKPLKVYMDELVVRAGRLEKIGYFDRVGKGTLSLVGQDRYDHDLEICCSFIFDY